MHRRKKTPQAGVFLFLDLGISHPMNPVFSAELRWQVQDFIRSIIYPKYFNTSEI